MLSACLAVVQKVELIGGESWLEHHSVAVAAITAAVLAALVSVLNQRAQLRHDRYLRNRDHIRDTLDAAIAIANEMNVDAENFLIAVTTLEEHRADMDPGALEKNKSSREEERWKVVSRLQAMKAAQSRLEIRLEEEDPILEAYDATRRAFASLLQHVHRGIRENRPEAECEGDDGRVAELELHFASLRKACRDWLTDPPRRRFARPHRNHREADAPVGADAQEGDG
jgi:hypothetical protein